MVRQEGNRLVIEEGLTRVYIECWGESSLRVRMTAEPEMDKNDWALCERVEEVTPVITFTEVDVTDPWYKGDEWKKYHQTGTVATLTNGKITAEVSPEGWIRFLNQRGEVLTEEYWRNRNRINRYCVPLRVDARELKPVMGSCDYELTARLKRMMMKKFSAWGSIRKSIWIKKAPLWSLPSEIPRQASRFSFPAEAMASSGTIRQSARQPSVPTRRNGMRRERRN